MENDKKMQKILSDHPLLFRHRQYFACGEGWFDLIERLAAKLEAMIKAIKKENPSLEDDDLPFCSDVKQKWGELRFYMSSETDEMSRAIEEAQDESLRTCESCGHPGEFVKGRILVLCEKCLKS